MSFEQLSANDITGTVTDSTGGVLPGVIVTAVCTQTNLTRSTNTDSQGGYTVPELPVCVYRVTTDIPGFKAAAAVASSSPEGSGTQRADRGLHLSCWVDGTR